MWQGEVVVATAKDALIYVAHHDVEATAIQTNVDVGIAEGIASKFGLLLCVEGHGGRLIVVAFIFGIVVAVYSYLEVEYLEGGEVEEEVAVDCELGEWYYRCVRCNLPVDAVVPVEYSYLEILVEPYIDELDIASVLAWQTVWPKVNIVL